VFYRLPDYVTSHVEFDRFAHRTSIISELNWTQKNRYHQCADTKVGKNVKACNIVFTLIMLKQHNFIVQTHSIWIQDSPRAQAADVNVACRRAYQSSKTVVQRLLMTLQSQESGGWRHSSFSCLSEDADFVISEFADRTWDINPLVEPPTRDGRMSDYDIRPKPKVWAGSPNECRTFGLTSAECCALG